MPSLLCIIWYTILILHLALYVVVTLIWSRVIGAMVQRALNWQVLINQL